MKKHLLSLSIVCTLIFGFAAAPASVSASSKGVAVQAADQKLLPVTKLQGPKLEQEWAVGLRGAYAGIIGNQLLLAGGENLEGNRFSSAAARHFSKSIYGAVINEKTKKLSWKKLGELPEPIAYGAAVATADALYLVGGENATGAKASITKIDFKDNQLQVDTIAYMPVLSTEGGAAVIDGKLHVLGGLQNGVASNKHWQLDLQQLKKGWAQLPICPETPRRLPVVSSQRDGSGREMLYIWGGYGTGQKGQPELCCEGYKYDPLQKTWKLLPSPLDSNFARVYLGGGKLLPVGEHQLAVVGGSGYQSLRLSLMQAPQDFYDHDNQWYSYNNKLFIYDTVSNKWECQGQAPEAAVALNTGAIFQKQLYILGGEIKPGVATNSIIRINALEAGKK